jgi:protein ImuA
MQILSCHDGKLLKVDSAELGGASAGRSFSTGLAAVDRLLPGGGLGRGVVHEVLWVGKGARPLFFAAWLARAAVGQQQGGRVVWCDPRGEIYPPALAEVGIALDRLFLLRPRTAEEEVWALAECLGCKGVAATLAQPPVLSRIAARRLQLAAERGEGVGLFLRPRGAGSIHHAAATRWLVEPARGERTVQRWKIQLIHGHGGLLHQPVYLEYSRDWRQPETHRVRATDQLGDRAVEKETVASA